MNEEYILACRGMNFDEYCKLEDLQKEYQSKHPDDKTGLGRLNLNYVMHKNYPDAKVESNHVGDVRSFYARTM